MLLKKHERNGILLCLGGHGKAPQTKWLKQWELFSLAVWGLEIQDQSLFLPTAVREKSVSCFPLASRSLLAIFSIPWLIEASPDLCLVFFAFDLGGECQVSVSKTSPFYKEISHMGLEAQLSPV